MKTSKLSYILLWPLRILYVLNTLLLLPCAYFTLALVTPLRTHGRLFLGAVLPIVGLRIYYIPYISSTILTAGYIYLIKKHICSDKERIFFSILLIITILGLISLEMVYSAVMGI